MTITNAVLLILNFVYLLAYEHQKPISIQQWPSKCAGQAKILNDCNWCTCENGKYVCKARVCTEVDMFGHFNDAIQELHGPMRIHGAWRTKDTSCEPLVQYERGDLLCICNADGNWPNPVCRDTFRVLHVVDISFKDLNITHNKCEPAKLYLVGCNVCICPDSERMDSSMCTKKNCTTEDPILHMTNKRLVRTENEDLEVYAECQLNRKYVFGCRKCVCLRNNRLLCDKCEMYQGKDENHEFALKSYCDNITPDEVFSIDCNFCLCDKKGLLYCTTRKCLGKAGKFVDISKLKDDGLINVDPPYDDLDCTPGTVYTKDCNTCICGKVDKSGQKFYSCTKNDCHKGKTALSALNADCVDGTVYESSCQVCRCNTIAQVKRETCRIETKCLGMAAAKKTRSLELNSLHGYCEPGHTYETNCNTCRCLTNGNIIMCTSSVCNHAGKDPVTVDLVPVTQDGGAPCPRNRMYKVNCNYCFCLANGNALCTTADCKSEKL